MTTIDAYLASRPAGADLRIDWFRDWMVSEYIRPTRRRYVQFFRYALHVPPEALELTLQYVCDLEKLYGAFTDWEYAIRLRDLVALIIPAGDVSLREEDTSGLQIVGTAECKAEPVELR